MAAPASAPAATEIGETFSPTTSCSPSLTRLQSDSPGDGYAVSSPGVITSWSHLAGASPPQLKLKVARPAGGGDFTIMGEIALELPAAAALNTYPIRIPVQPADVIRLYNPIVAV